MSSPSLSYRSYRSLSSLPSVRYSPLPHVLPSFPSSSYLPSRKFSSSSSSSSGGDNSGMSMMDRLLKQFKDRFIHGHDAPSYIRPTLKNRREGEIAPDKHVFRTPAPANQPRAVIPKLEPERVFDISYYKRESVRVAPPPRANELIFRKHCTTEFLPDYALPHTPKPWWWNQQLPLAMWRVHYIRSGGVALAGAHRPRHNKNKNYYQVGRKPELLL